VIKISFVLFLCFPAFLFANDSKFDTEIYLDARYTISKGEPSWVDNWLGKGRYGGELDGGRINKFRFSEIAVLTKFDINWDLKGFVYLKNDPEQGEPVDLVEAYVRYKPAPSSVIAYEIKAGLMFPHISRENIGVAWASPYTISPSAINSWVGEEIRVLGIEMKAKYQGDINDITLSAAIFGFNDPAGTLLAYRGWGIGDAKVGIQGELPLARLPSIGPNSTFLKQPNWVRPIREIDERAGYYLALDWTLYDFAQFGGLYYDNRGDPKAIEAGQYAWRTKFFNLYAELTLGLEIKVIAQYMQGSTKMGEEIFGGGRQVDVDYDAGFLLLSKQMGKFRASIRYDWFKVDDNTHILIDNNNEDGDALTLAFLMMVRGNASIIIEYLNIKSDRPAREDIGFESYQKNKTIQLAYRMRI